MVRLPAVAGRFYSGEAHALRAEITGCFKSPIGPGSSAAPAGKADMNIIGAVSPHAGYMFSGPVAAHLFMKLWAQEPPTTVIILGPNHTGYGAGVAISDEDFETPLGTAKNDSSLVSELASDLIVRDPSAHAYEHSLEVQIPFMQYIGWDAKIVPICIGTNDYETLAEVGERIHDCIARRDDVLVLASSDMSHYVPAKVAKALDQKAIDCILALDPECLYQTVLSNNISMCGAGPVVCMLKAVMGSKAKLLKYATSGDVQPMHEVVGYAAISVER